MRRLPAVQPDSVTRRLANTRFEPGDTVRFTSKRDWIIGEVEEIRGGHEGDHLLVVRQGGPWSGDRYMVLSSYSDKL